jgi:hypothetical protein
MTEKKSNRKANGLGCLAGGIVFCLLFPLCVYFFGWLSFAFGLMGCAFPSQCSAAEMLNLYIKLYTPADENRRSLIEIKFPSCDKIKLT